MRLFCLIFFNAYLLSGQITVDTLYPDLNGSELFNAVNRDYQPVSVFTYGPARDTLFAKIHAKNGRVVCVYTGYSLPLIPGQDPTQSVFMNGEPLGINTEHVWPQSLGARNDPQRADMHHLFPCRIDANSARGSLEFAEIPDAQTLKWFKEAQTLETVPTSDIDDYSEWDNLNFEPRENRKGDVARALFYFYTIHNTQALQNGGDFFDNQKELLCEWHCLDAVDEEEYERTFAIAGYQGVPNPFIADPTLPVRLGYCPSQPDSCGYVITVVKERVGISDITFQYDPIAKTVMVKAELPAQGLISADWCDASGKIIHLESWTNVARGRFEQNIGLEKCSNAGWVIIKYQNDLEMDQIAHFIFKGQ